jgi:hypothetical protein
MKLPKVFLFIVSVLHYCSVGNASDELIAKHTNSRPRQSSPFDYAGGYRASNDCGPISLFVLMKLRGFQVKIQEVLSSIIIDPVNGCSAGQLVDAADSFGFALEVKYVVPGKLHSVPFPFILHGKIGERRQDGHFYVVVDYDKKRGSYGVIDPSLESFTWFNEKTVQQQFSGYVIVPKKSNFLVIMDSLLAAAAISCFLWTCWVIIKRYGKTKPNQTIVIAQNCSGDQ